jgi:predicted O-methyltransferase YrrM
MITSESGRHLFSLCYFQVETGDVVEVGSWQGRSSSYLARAVQLSGNGRFYAVDHFRGNVGKEHCYRVNNHDLSDLKDNFLRNIDAIGLKNHVTLLDVPNADAAGTLSDASVRFLFIDGDHTENGVDRDIGLFFPKLINGAIVVFDDFSNSFPGVVKCIKTLLNKSDHSRVMAYENTIVLKFKNG